MENQNNSNTDKVKALAENIIAECKQQGFTLKNVEDLIRHLESAWTVRLFEKYQDSF